MKKPLMMLLLLWLTTLLAVEPPSYLATPYFKQCLKTQDQGTWTSWCLPAQRAVGCPCSSWHQLQQTTIPKCPESLKSSWGLRRWSSFWDKMVCLISFHFHLKS